MSPGEHSPGSHSSPPRLRLPAAAPFRGRLCGGADPDREGRPRRHRCLRWRCRAGCSGAGRHPGAGHGRDDGRRQCCSRERRLSPDERQHPQVPRRARTTGGVPSAPADARRRRHRGRRREAGRGRPLGGAPRIGAVARLSARRCERRRARGETSRGRARSASRGDADRPRTGDPRGDAQRRTRPDGARSDPRTAELGRHQSCRGRGEEGPSGARGVEEACAGTVGEGGGLRGTGRDRREAEARQGDRPAGPGCGQRSAAGSGPGRVQPLSPAGSGGAATDTARAHCGARRGRCCPRKAHADSRDLRMRRPSPRPRPT